MSVMLAMSLASVAPVKVGLAATPANPPTPALPLTPGQVQSTLPVQPAIPQPKAAPPVTLPQQAAPSVPSGGPTVTVQSFDITGNSVYSANFLRTLLADYLNRPLTVEDLYKAADAVTAYYQTHGYSVARATVPLQKIEGGVVTLQVVEGRIGKLDVQGNTRTRSSVIERQSAAFKAGDVYTDAAMDRAVLLVNDLPGVQAQAVLAAGSEFGTTDLVYQTQEQGYNGSASVDDYGPINIGRWRANVEASVNSLTGSGDRLTADLTHSQDDLLNFGGLTYSLPLGPDGGRLGAAYSHSEYHLRIIGNPNLAAIEPGGNGKNASLSYNYAWERSRAENLYWGVGVQHAGTNTIDLGKVVAQSNLNTLNLTGYYDRFHDDGGYWAVNSSFTSNGRYNDGSDPKSIEGAERAKLTLDASLLQPFAKGSWTYSARASGQWTPDPLVDTEKFSLGGPDSARGFPSADVRGDSGLFGTAELQRVFSSEFAVGGFLDAGKAWSAGGSPRSQSRAAKATVYDAGFELVYTSPSKRWTAKLQWASAFGAGLGGSMPTDGNDGGHIWTTIGVNF